MYWQHFGLASRPFGAGLGAAGPYLGAGRRTALALLEHSTLERTGFVVIVGEAGTGKSVLLRHLAGRLGSGVAVALLVDPLPRFGPIIGRVLLTLGLDVAEAAPLVMIDQFHLLHAEIAAAGRRIVIVVDEAQSLGMDELDELRMLSNIGDGDFRPQVVLGGQPALRETLHRPELAQLAQRIIGEYELKPLDGIETQDYIQFRLASAGAGRVIFDKSACQAVHEFARGIPRLVDTLCEDAMIFGGLTGRDTIDAGLVTDMSRDRCRGGLLQPGCRPAIATVEYDDTSLPARAVAS